MIEPHKIITYTLAGDPVPLARARLNMTTKVFYDSQKHTKLKLAIDLSHQHGERPPYSGPLQLDVIFFMHKPKTSKERMARMENAYHSSRPDLDNLEKMLCDLLQFPCPGEEHGILKDDCIIAVINAQKRYSGNPRTVFTIKELPHGS